MPLHDRHKQQDQQEVDGLLWLFLLVILTLIILVVILDACHWVQFSEKSDETIYGTQTRRAEVYIFPGKVWVVRRPIKRKQEEIFL